MPEWLARYPEESLVHKAYQFAVEAHKNEKRQNGDPYIVHCLKVAETVSSWGLDDTSVAAALLHDVVEDTPFTMKDILKRFGNETVFLVEGLTKLDTLSYPQGNPEAENLRKLIISFSKDLRVLLIKLADRLHNMQTLAFLPEERRKKIAWETMEIYAPLAYRLGMQHLSGELEDLAFPHIHPEAYAWLLSTVKASYDERLEYAERMKPIVERLLEENGVHPLCVDARAKRYSSLYKKLLRHDMDLEKIYDLVALRIVVGTLEECYSTLGIIHKQWAPLPGRIKDYIARPKPNGYRSLHTTVFCAENIITEFQIRTKEMHEENELGIAAHWAYQQIKSSKSLKERWGGIGNRRELLWVKQLHNWQKNLAVREDFIQSLKVEFFKDRIFVITPHNDVIDLPARATPVDFAYRIHSEIGNQCVGAKVNGKIVPLDFELRSGDMVEIITQKGKKPSEGWLRFVKTEMAKKQIRSITRGKMEIPSKKEELPHMVFRVVSHDRPGYLKEITGAFAELKIHIVHLTSETDPRKVFSVVTAKCDILPKEKIEKVLLKLKKVAGTKEVNYTFNR